MPETRVSHEEEGELATSRYPGVSVLCLGHLLGYRFQAGGGHLGEEITRPSKSSPFLHSRPPARAGPRMFVTSAQRRELE